VVLSNNSYNETGQLKRKQLHNIDTGNTFLQRTKYAYNERGWLKNNILQVQRVIKDMENFFI